MYGDVPWVYTCEKCPSSSSASGASAGARRSISSRSRTDSRTRRNCPVVWRYRRPPCSSLEDLARGPRAEVVAFEQHNGKPTQGVLAGVGRDGHAAADNQEVYLHGRPAAWRLSRARLTMRLARPNGQR